MDYERLGIISTLVILLFFLSMAAVLSQGIEFTAKKDTSEFTIPQITSSTKTSIPCYPSIICHFDD